MKHPHDALHSSRQRPWSAEVVGSVLAIQFRPGLLCPEADLECVAALEKYFDQLSSGPIRVIHVTVPSGELAHEKLVRLREYFRTLDPTEYTFLGRDYRARTELLQENNALQRFITCVRDERIFVTVAFGGEVDIDLFGLLLACDYRIASDDTVIVNRGQLFGTSLGTAVPWFFSRIMGYAQALKVLLGWEEVPVRRASELGLVDRVTHRESHPREALEIVQGLVAKGPRRLLSVKRALAASAISLQSYLDHFGAGFEQLPVAVPSCKQCGYNLTGNTSGRCPECGLVIDETAIT